MNAAIRAIVRTALNDGLEVFAICEGYQGMVDGGQYIYPMTWDSVGGILQKGGTIIGTARCDAFRTHEGRRQAAKNLLINGIDSLIVIGGDGSLTGAHIFRLEWPTLLNELVAQGEISKEVAERHAYLKIVGLVGSIDNDMSGTDMTIGTDTALHRIIEAVDAISSTAASHQRTFVVKVMGRNCGYLALMAGLATGAGWVLIPENPPETDAWEAQMIADLKAGRKAGRRDSIVIMAEGAQDRHGNPIGSSYVVEVLEKSLHEEVRATVLGHVQRGGKPSAFDRTLGTLMGQAAVAVVRAVTPDSEPQLICLTGNRITTAPLMACVEHNQAIAQAIANHDYETAMNLRGNGFKESYATLQTLLRSLPHEPVPGQRRLRLAVMNCGAPAPGMNTAVRAAVRLGLDKGHVMLAVQNGFRGLIDGEISEFDWMRVNDWATLGGAELGTSRYIPNESDLQTIADNITQHHIEGLLIIGGYAAYQVAYDLRNHRETLPALKIPVICLPASIDNNLPGSELSIGADTAINSIVWAVDRLKQSAIAQRRCFVVEVMGRYCGYLALISGLATGAECVYLHEEGLTLRDLIDDVDKLRIGFKHGKRLGLIIRNENANPTYDSTFVSSLFEEEGRPLFDVRQTILGHVQQGGDPSPFDRIQATRLAARCVDFLIKNAQAGETPMSAFIGLQAGGLQIQDIALMPELIDLAYERPKDQWWLNIRPIARVLAQSVPTGNTTLASSEPTLETEALSKDS
jgi:6-phosphofructokinase 1